MAGVALDAVSGSPPGRLFAFASAIAAAASALACSWPDTWWLMPAPPLFVAAVTACAEALGDAAPLPGTSGAAATTALRCAIDAFPAMAVAEAMVLVLGPARALVAGRGVRSRYGTRSNRA